MEGLKFDTGKLRWDLLPLECIEDCVKVLTMGANKYAPNNWQKVEGANERYYAALLRHLSAWRQGEEIDPESGVSHLGHIMCNVIFLSWLEKQNKNEKLPQPEIVAATTSSMNAQPQKGTIIPAPYVGNVYMNPNYNPNMSTNQNYLNSYNQSYLNN